ncbi:hypothetical protein K040078D81_01350 [Blautia hominis]|uniref:Uncharacterized protein n=1 Tax=Blautia hominis TaxID=2025493 RepID=A0ABQ0B3M5_9FIRM
MRMSKTGRYENPYTVTGGIQRTGTKGKPKGICTDRDDGTRKGWNTERLHAKKCWLGKAVSYNQTLSN